MKLIDCYGPVKRRTVRLIASLRRHSDSALNLPEEALFSAKILKAAPPAVFVEILEV